MSASGSILERGPLVAVEEREGSDQGQTRLRPGSDRGQTRLRPGSDPILSISGLRKKDRLNVGRGAAPLLAALALIDGRTVEPRIDTGTELVSSANAAKYKK